MHYFGQTDHFRCRMKFEVDPNTFSAIIDEMETELAAY
jgi:hypothetical protein